ncbi:hypothetical protein [Vibrio ouci]|nr:hypothetical protein [Vibrio ouci]
MNKMNVLYAAMGVSELSILGGKPCSQSLPFSGGRMGSMIEWRQ